MASAPVISAALMIAGMLRYESMFRGGPMQTAWSAKRTWSWLASASEYTATVLIPSSLHAHRTRRAISPRFAMRIFLNKLGPDSEEGLAVLHGLAVVVVDLHDFPRHLALDLVHELHGFDDAEHLPDLDVVAHAHERGGIGIGRAVEGADDRALDHGQAVGGFVGHGHRSRDGSGGRRLGLRRGR